MKIAIAQTNPMVGDVKNNAQLIVDHCQRAAAMGAEIVITPELSLIGYPPKDLVLREDFLRVGQRGLEWIANVTPVPVIVGAAIKNDRSLPFNAAMLCHDGRYVVVATKILLPNYNVFDEKRYFSPTAALACRAIDLNGFKILLSICEDAWNAIEIAGQPTYGFDPIAEGIEAHGPIDLIINMSASPFSKHKPKKREALFTGIAKRYGVFVLTAGQVGANDQLLFDGHSMIIDGRGLILDRAPAGREGLLLFDPSAAKTVASHEQPHAMELLMEMLALGIRDYVEKCHAPGVIIGVSGGIDSAVCAALAVKALGADRVRAVFLPSRFSSERSLRDARSLCDNLRVRLDVFAIEESVQGLRKLLASAMSSTPINHQDIADQNIQSRLRGLIIMGLSNLSGHLMIATSNKSELAVGYSTLYGDMCGAFSPIGDLYKTEVMKLAEFINRSGELIPRSILHKLPTAELKEGQLDTDILPPYAILDKILFNFIDLDMSEEEIIDKTAIDQELVRTVIAMVGKAEYKRRQAPFCLMVSDRVFGDARRLPIAKQWSIESFDGYLSETEDGDDQNY